MRKENKKMKKKKKKATRVFVQEVSLEKMFYFTFYCDAIYCLVNYLLLFFVCCYQSCR